MKILHNNIKKDGSVRIETEEEDDMYHLYNLIVSGDILESVTTRNV
jgi:stalled ribosome rescue protein Dom34